jgi:tetratricopeptide (TPR) repeat protein
MKKIKEISKLISYLAWQWRANGRLQKLWTSKEYVELLSFCNLMLRKNPMDYLAFYYRGLSNEALNLFDESIADFKKSEIMLRTFKAKRLLNDYFTRIPIQISRVYRKLQDHVMAVEYADKAVQANNKQIDGLKWRASLKEEFGDYIGACEDLNEALKRRPKDKILTKMRNRLTYIIIEDKRETANR